MLQKIGRRNLFFVRNSHFARLFFRYNSNLPSRDASVIDLKIAKIVEDISKLTLLETSSLINELKEKLNIPEIAMPIGVGPAAAASQAVEEPKEIEEKEKTIFNLKLESFDVKSKPKIIKEVKTLLGLSLVEAKKFVEAAPKVLKENVANEEAKKIKATLEGLGAKISLD